MEENSEDATDSISMAQRIKNLDEMECYKYIPLPNPLISKALANYEPPKYGADFPFIQMTRWSGIEHVTD
jgi:hypothetical protein